MMAEARSAREFSFFVAALDLVVVLEVDKIRAFQVRNLERF